MVSCSCIPPPASLKPRKIYNLLVPDVFTTLIPPKIDEPISTGLKRKFNKLQEYVEQNPSKAAKVSRRLTRRIKKALYDRQLGFVKVAVHAYIYLIDKSVEEDSTYTFNYFNKELIHQPDAVIHTLLTYPNTQVQTLGADLLAAYMRAQTEVDHQADASTYLVEAVVKLPEAAKERAAGSTGAGGGGGGADLALVEGCLGALKEYVSLCQRVRILPALLEQIEVLTLDSVEQDPAAVAWLKYQAQKLQTLGAAGEAAAPTDRTTLGSKPPQGQAAMHVTAPAAAAPASEGSLGQVVTSKIVAVISGTSSRRSSLNLADGARPASVRTSGGPGGGGVGHGGVSKSASLAVEVLRNFRPFLRDIASVRRVMETLLRWLDGAGRWEWGELVEGLLAVVRRAAGDLTFPVTSALMRHAATPGLSPRTRITVVEFALKQGQVYPLSALSLALMELPRAVAAGADADVEALGHAVTGAVAHLARCVGDAGQVAEALAVALKGHTGGGGNGREAGSGNSNAVLLAALEAGVAAASEIQSMAEGSRLFPGRSLPASLLHTLTPLVVVPPAARDVALMARRLLTAMLPAIGGPLRDDKQAVHLAQLARALLLGSPTTPPDHLGVPAADELLSPEEFEMAAKYMEVVVGCGSPMALLAAAHVALEAAGGVAKTGKGTATPVFSVRGGAATLQLCAVVAQQLGAASNCPQLGDRCKSVPEAAGLAPELTVVGSGRDARLRAASLAWGVDHTSASATGSGSSTSGPASLAVVAGKWCITFKAALCETGTLAAEHGEALAALLDQTLPPPALQAAPVVALGSAGLLLPSPATQQPHNSSSVRPASPDSAGVGASGTRALPAAAEAALPQAVDALQQRLAAEAWGMRAQTLKRERLNLERVMDLLAPGEKGSGDAGGDGSRGGQQGGAGDAVASLLGDGSGGVEGRKGLPGVVRLQHECVDVGDVLAVLAQVEKGMGQKEGLPGARLDDLAVKLEPVHVPV